MIRSSPARTIITVVMDVLVVWAVVLLVHLVVSVFGVFATTTWGKQLLQITSLAVLPLPLADISTPYGGAFDAAAAVTIPILMLAEWALSVVRT